MRRVEHGISAWATIVLLATAQGVAAKDMVVHAGALIDGTGQPARSRVSILIHDERIVAVEPGFQTPAGAEVVDLSGETVTPGFIDCHIHLSARLPGEANATEDWLTRNDLSRAFQGALYARQMLQQGFTSARDVGGGNETVAIRDAVRARQISGPRLWVSLEPLGPTAGHGDPRDGLDPALSHPGWDNGLVDSPDEARLRVREHRRCGADPRQQLMTNEEMKAAVDAAHALGMKVAAHIYPAEAIENAVAAGVDSVEHGSFATARTFALMKAHGTYLTPTLTVYELFYAAARDHPEQLTPGTAPKEMANDLLPKRNLPLAGERMARLAERGSPKPALLTLLIAVVLGGWAVYAFSGAGLGPRLPFRRSILTLISAAYLLRAAALPVMLVFMRDRSRAFLVWSSAVVLVYGVVHAAGTLSM